eukprot:m.688920 g.688920  ORF g.688920 m.688920 type:complete len:107 (+) comp58634_c0_seq51:389-709(+)
MCLSQFDHLLAAADSNVYRDVLPAAARLGRITMLKHLLSLPKFCAVINQQDFGGSTPIMRAVEGGHLECFDLCRDAGAILECPKSVSEDQNRTSDPCSSDAVRMSD